MAGMGSLFHFAVGSVRRSLGASIATAVLIALGVNVQDIAKTFLTNPPEILLAWWPPWVFVIIAFVLLSHIFQKQVEWLNHSGPRADASVLWLFNHLNNKSSWAIGRGYNDGKIADDIEQGIRDAAKAGRITIWGRQIAVPYFTAVTPSRTQTEIEPAYWMEAGIDLTTVYTNENVPVKTHAYDKNRTQEFNEIEISKSQCLKEWKRGSFNRRRLDRKYKDRKLKFREV